MKLRFSETAAKDLESVYDFIAQDHPEAALQTTQDLFAVMERQLSFPQMVRPSVPGTRELLKPSFVIVYRTLEDIISIESVFHGSRRYQSRPPRIVPKIVRISHNPINYR